MGFWSTLAGVGASLIPGVGPILGPLVAGVGSLFGGGSSGSSATSSTNSTTSSTGTGNTDLDALVKQASSPNPQSQNAYNDLAPAKSYFTRALGGDENSLSDLLGPEISTVLGQYDTAAKTATELGPRGGGRNAVLAGAPFKKAEAYGTALAGARTGAAKGLTDVAGSEGAIAQGETNSREQLIGPLLGRQNNLDKINYDKSRDTSKAYGDIGSSIGSILINLLKNKGSKSGGGSNTSAGGISTIPSGAFGGLGD